MVLVQWLNLFKDDATWEELDVNELIQQFPDFNTNYWGQELCLRGGYCYNLFQDGIVAEWIQQ